MQLKNKFNDTPWIIRIRKEKIRTVLYEEDVEQRRMRHAVRL